MVQIVSEGTGPARSVDLGGSIRECAKLLYDKHPQTNFVILYHYDGKQYGLETNCGYDNAYRICLHAIDKLYSVLREKFTHARDEANKLWHQSNPDRMGG